MDAIFRAKAEAIRERNIKEQQEARRQKKVKKV